MTTLRAHLQKYSKVVAVRILTYTFLGCEEGTNGSAIVLDKYSITVYEFYSKIAKEDFGNVIRSEGH